MSCELKDTGEDNCFIKSYLGAIISNTVECDCSLKSFNAGLCCNDGANILAFADIYEILDVELSRAAVRLKTCELDRNLIVSLVGKSCFEDILYVDCSEDSSVFCLCLESVGLVIVEDKFIFVKCECSFTCSYSRIKESIRCFSVEGEAVCELILSRKVECEGVGIVVVGYSCNCNLPLVYKCVGVVCSDYFNRLNCTVICYPVFYCKYSLRILIEGSCSHEYEGNACCICTADAVFCRKLGNGGDSLIIEVNHIVLSSFFENNVQIVSCGDKFVSGNFCRNDRIGCSKNVTQYDRISDYVVIGIIVVDCYSCRICRKYRFCAVYFDLTDRRIACSVVSSNFYLEFLDVLCSYIKIYYVISYFLVLTSFGIGIVVYRLTVYSVLTCDIDIICLCRIAVPVVCVTPINLHGVKVCNLIKSNFNDFLYRLCRPLPLETVTL